MAYLIAYANWILDRKSHQSYAVLRLASFLIRQRVVKRTGAERRTSRMDMSPAKETIWSETILKHSRHGDEVAAIRVVSTINDL